MLARKIAVILALASSAGAAHAALVVSDAATSDVQCAAGTCTATAANAVLNATELAGMLASGDVTVKAANGAASIAVTAPVSWTSASRLTLDASDGIGIRAPVVAAGTGAMTITTNDGGSGDLNFPGEGRIEFWDTSSSLIINRHGYTLVNSLTSLAQAVKVDQRGFYALAKSYDAGPDGTYKKAPVDKPGLKGTFEGLGNAISNLAIDHAHGQMFQTSNVGLFSSSSGTIRDIDVLDAHIREQNPHRSNIGVLVGLNSGTILQAAVTVNLLFEGGTVTSAVGGVAGVNNGMILRSHADVAIDGGFNVVRAGGLVGINDTDGVISQCYSTGSVTTTLGFEAIAGGLVGIGNTGSTITLSHSSAAVSAGAAAGGLVGEQSGTVTQSFSDGAVTGHGEAGGLFGSGAGTATNVYSTGSVTDGGIQGGAFGGLMGSDNFNGGPSFVTAAYAAGSVSPNAQFFGAIVGFHVTSSGLESVYWDKEATGISDPSKGAGNTDNVPGVKMLKDKQLKAKLPAGFDPAIWGQKKTINNGLPYLLSNPPGQ